MSYWNYANRHPTDRDEEYPFWLEYDKQKKTKRPKKPHKVSKKKKSGKIAEAKKAKANQGVPVLFLIDLSNMSKADRVIFFEKKEITLEIENSIKQCCNVTSPTFLFIIDEHMYMAQSQRIRKNGTYSIGERMRISKKDLSNYYFFQESGISDLDIPFAVICSKNAKLNKLASILAENSK